MTDGDKGKRRRAGDVRQLAAATLLTERTVYRWFRDPSKAHFGNKARLETAARRMGIPLPAGAPA